MQTRQSPSMSTLHSLARQAAIPGYLHLPKGILYNKLQEQFNIERLKRAEARNNKAKRKRSNFEDKFDEDSSHKKKKDMNEVKSKITSSKIKLNKIDPIMMNPLGKNVYTFMRSNGSGCRFNVESLVDYLLTSGDFHDPETRIQFSDNDLKAIDKAAVKAGLSKPSVLDAKRNPQRYSEGIFFRDAIQGLERCAGEVITDILYIIEECGPEEAEMRLLTSEFPTFADFYGQLAAADTSHAKQCLKSWKLFITGPPNRPTRDEFGMLPIVLMFLRECELTPIGQNRAQPSQLQSQSQPHPTL